MSEQVTLEELWEGPVGDQRFDPADIAGLPEPARRYLEHAIAPGTPLARAVRLRMHGDIRLQGRWLPFSAEQVIRWDRGMIWKATVRMAGLPIRGSDRIIDGEAAMRWKLFGIVPVMQADGPDISRSTLGRVEAETIWLPSALLADGVRWEARDDSHVMPTVRLQGDIAQLDLTVAPDGALQSSKLARWGNPEGENFHLVDFGGLVEDEGSFDGYTIPTTVRVGWYLGSDRFDREGEFFRVTVDEATFR